jgi:hypothetical protein
VLKSTLERLCQVRGGTIFVTGHRGSGKTSLSDKLADYGELCVICNPIFYFHCLSIASPAF